MRTVQWFLSLLALSFSVIAQEVDITAVLGQLPDCALSCLVTIASKSPCGLINSTCLCNDQLLQIEVQKCVLEACTIRQSLTTKNITSVACDAPVTYKDENTKTFNIVWIVLNSVLLIMRVIYQAFFSSTGLVWEDYSAVVANVFGIPSVVMIDRGVLPSGLGRDVWKMPFETIRIFARWLYILEIFYVLQLTLLKLTLLLLLLRIFPKVSTRRLLWATLVLNLVWGFTFLFVAIFQCRPISSAWNSWDQKTRGNCLNINTLCWVHAGINITFDVWMLGLPLYEVAQLRMAWRKKLAVSIMFCAGTVFTVISMLRLQTLVVFATSSNPTLDQSNVFRWSTLEIQVGLLCASLPALRSMTGRVLSKLSGNPKSTSQSYAVPNSSHKRTADKLGNDMDTVKSLVKDSDTILCTHTFGVAFSEDDESSLLHMRGLPLLEPELEGNKASISAG